MKELNLTATTPPQRIIKEYLENNVSDILADKINNGVKIERDGKTLINKKTLDGFMNYATEEARKQAEKGARSACIESNVVFGWAVHYFEEDSIEGTLYNEDGTEYAKPKAAPKKKKAAETKPIETKPTVQKQAEKTVKTKPTTSPLSEQISLFDCLEEIPLM